MENYLQVLKNEFDAEDGSFLILLRSEMSWDKEAFIRLATAMEACCEKIAAEEKIDRWLAAGFWYVPQFAIDWSSHPEFPRRHSPEYYKAAYGLLHVLADRFFYATESEINKAGLVKNFLKRTEPENYNLFETE